MTIKNIDDTHSILVTSYSLIGNLRNFIYTINYLYMNGDILNVYQKYISNDNYGSYISDTVYVNMDIIKTSVNSYILCCSPKCVSDENIYNDYAHVYAISSTFENVTEITPRSGSEYQYYVIGNRDKIIWFAHLKNNNTITIEEYDATSDYRKLSSTSIKPNMSASFWQMFVYKCEDFYVIRCSDSFDNYKFIYIDSNTYEILNQTEELEGYLGIFESRIPVSTSESVIIYKQSTNTLISGLYGTTGTRRLSLNDGNYTYYNTYDSNVIAENILQNSVAYNNDGKIVGTMLNNGELNYESSTEEQTIPAGYTSGGTIAPAPLTDTEYDECLELSEQILGENVSL